MNIPYGNGFLEYNGHCDELLISAVDKLRANGSGAEIVRKAMAAPIGSPPLSELAEGKKDCVIIISDHTRPVPSRDILPEMINQLKKGSPDIKITLLVATGFHRLTRTEELKRKLGPELMGECSIVVHDCRDADSNVEIGVLPSGAPLVIDKVAARAQLLIAEGFVEPHFFAGFSGGRKSVLPGICDRVTVLGNHCSRFIDSPFSRTGILDGNPINADMTAAARMAGLAFIVNVVLDESKNIVAAFAGDCIEAHSAGCRFLMEYCQVTAHGADIVITSNGGAPLDQNIYQCVKGLTAAEAACNPEGVIIMCAECADGHGGDGFYDALRLCESPAALYAQQMSTPWDKTVPDQWESQILARILINHRVIFVTRPELRGVIEDMKMTYAPTVAQAMETARKCGKETVAVIPNGISVIVKKP